MHNMYTLGIDTSNYATSVAVVDAAKHEIVFFEKRFLPVEEGKIGIRQQQALFYHIKNLTDIFSQYDIPKIDAIGVSTQPRDGAYSYMPCFLRGKMSAYSIASGRNIPVIECSHQTGHITSALYYLNKEELFNQKICMAHVSGGTTDIMLAENCHVLDTVGTSLDLFAGQAVDRLGVKLGFPFPAGQYVSDLALCCDENIKVKTSVHGSSCNLSGLENQCDKLLSDGKSKEYVCKYCLTFIADTLIEMIKTTLSQYGDMPVVMAGGVMSSEVIKNIFKEKMPQVMFVDPKFSRDNAIGVAANAYRKVANG